MGWLLELLIEGIQEKCSQFIIDVMSVVTQMFTELLSCDLNLFEGLFGVVGLLYKNVIIPLAIALLFLICIWQLFKSMFGKVGMSSEDPIELLGRSCACLFMIVGSRSMVNYILRIAGTPYQWIVGTDITVNSFSEYVSSLEGVTSVLGIDAISMLVLTLIMQFVVAWNYFKMLFIVAERYVLLGVFTYTAPLAFATGGSKATNNVLASWAKMFGGQVILIILNAWCMKMFLSAYGNMLASGGYGYTKFFVATLCLVGFCKITFKLDTYMASLGVNLGRSSNGLGAMGLFMAANKVFSSFRHIGTQGMPESPSSGGRGSAYTSSYDMPGTHADPIPISPRNAADTGLGHGSMESEPEPEVQGKKDSMFDISSFESESDNVLEALGEMPADTQKAYSNDAANSAVSGGNTVENTMESTVEGSTVYANLEKPAVDRLPYGEALAVAQRAAVSGMERNYDASREDVAGIEEAIYSGNQVIPMEDAAQQDEEQAIQNDLNDSNMVQDPFIDENAEIAMDYNEDVFGVEESGAGLEEMDEFAMDNNVGMLNSMRSDINADTIGDGLVKKDENVLQQEEKDMGVHEVMLEDAQIPDSTTGSTGSAYDGSVISESGISSAKSGAEIAKAGILSEIGAKEPIAERKGEQIVPSDRGGTADTVLEPYGLAMGMTESGLKDSTGGCDTLRGTDAFIGGQAPEAMLDKGKVSEESLYEGQQTTSVDMDEWGKSLDDSEFHPVPESLPDGSAFGINRQDDGQTGSQTRQFDAMPLKPVKAVSAHSVEAKTGGNEKLYASGGVWQENNHLDTAGSKDDQQRAERTDQRALHDSGQKHDEVLPQTQIDSKRTSLYGKEKRKQGRGIEDEFEELARPMEEGEDAWQERLPDVPVSLDETADSNVSRAASSDGSGLALSTGGDQ